MARRLVGTVGALLLVGATLVLSSSPAQAAGTIDPWSSTVAVGASFSVTATGCPLIEEERDDGFTYQRAQLLLITGSGATERMAAFGRPAGGTRYRFTVPGWVDPAEPAVVAGACITTTYTWTEGEGGEEEVTETFTFPDAPMDITPGTASPSGPITTLDRSTAAGGQVINVSITGCEGGESAEAFLVEGGDLSYRTFGDFAADVGDALDGDGSAVLPLALNRPGDIYDEDNADPGGPLAPGDYTLLSVCYLYDGDESYTFGEPQLVTVTAGFDSADWALTIADDEVRTMGGSCLPGATVTVRVEGWVYEDLLASGRARSRALAKRSFSDLARLQAPDPDGRIEDVLTTTAAADGTWSVSSPAPEAPGYELRVTPDCGDPSTTGFRYITRSSFSSGFADLYVERTSPTSTPTGGTVQVTVGGYCEGEVAVGLVDDRRNVVVRSAPIGLNAYGMGTGSFTAPTTAGRYGAVGFCDEDTSYPEPYDVFEPETVSATEPLPDEPTEGWPTRGERATYHGKIGPIDLPADGMEDMAEPASRLGPGGLFIDVPRPDGDFAITQITFDLVDEDGMPVGQDQAHLHHFVIANASGKNPACPNGTFGLPGQIVAASGAERTVLQTGDPYAVVVKDTDRWTGVYEVMNRSMSAQRVYLTYDLTYRRDVDNVRPVTSYFGSASGCSSFTWTLDGNGEPDTQSTFITIAKDARMIGTGAHIHNGAVHADMTNDRGRRLCRSEIEYGDMPVGHAHQRAEATTTMVEPTEPTDEWPPEFYDDDLEIEGISTCPLAESVSAGERLRFDAVYENDRPRSGVMGIYTFYVWEGGGPAEPGPGGAQPVPGDPNFTG